MTFKSILFSKELAMFFLTVVRYMNPQISGAGKNGSFTVVYKD